MSDPQTLGQMKAHAAKQVALGSTPQGGPAPTSPKTDIHGAVIEGKCTSMILASMAFERVTGAKPDMDRMAGYCMRP